MLRPAFWVVLLAFAIHKEHGPLYQMFPMPDRETCQQVLEELLTNEVHESWEEFNTTCFEDPEDAATFGRRWVDYERKGTNI